jgi:hypothetical protein
MDIKPKYKTIFHSQLLKALETIIDPKLLEYYFINDIIPMSDGKRWVIELKPDVKKQDFLQWRDEDKMLQRRKNENWR